MRPLDDFYIGYQPQPPSGIGEFLRRVAWGLAAICLLFAIVLVSGQAPFAESRFEYGVVRDYEGELLEWPYPMLMTSNGRYLLVGPGKFGAADIVQGHDGSQVRLRGSLISRGSQRMLEIDPASLRFQHGAHAVHEMRDLGLVTLTGEIVDTKCHLGVMNPGDGKVHRDCAVRCISGGAPPGFLVRDADGQTRLLLLTGWDGRALGRELVSFVAEPVTISGHLFRHDEMLVLKAEPRDFRRE